MIAKLVTSRRLSVGPAANLGVRPFDDHHDRPDPEARAAADLPARVTSSTPLMRRRLLVFALATACVGSPEENVRRPCPDEPDWDPNLPVALRWGNAGLVELNEHVARRLSLVDAEGGEVEAFAFAFPGGLGLCVLGGLTPDRGYTWTVTDGTEPRVQEVDTVATLRAGAWAFHTAAAGVATAARTVEDCVNVATAEPIYDEQCAEFLPDTGDTADSGEEP